MSGENIWLTGASSGIGKHLARQLAQQNHHVFVSARSREALADLCVNEPALSNVPCDVVDRRSIANAGRHIEQEAGYLDRVIINAGTCEYLDVGQPDWDMMRRVMDVNYFGAINTLEQALPLLRRAPGKRGHIVVVGSLSSIVPFPRAEAYGSSKAAVTYLFDSLRVDLARENIAVTVVQPGFVATPLTAKNNFPMPFLLDVETAARIIVKKLPGEPRRIHFPRRMAWLLRAFSLLPSLWFLVATKLLSRGAAGAD